MSLSQKPSTCSEPILSEIRQESIIAEKEKRNSSSILSYLHLNVDHTCSCKDTCKLLTHLLNTHKFALSIILLRHCLCDLENLWALWNPCCAWASTNNSSV